MIFGVQYKPPSLESDQIRLLWDEIVNASRHDNIILPGKDPGHILSTYRQPDFTQPSCQE